MKTAFVLSAGGAKGAWQVGVIRQLTQKGIQPDVIYGTSVGAVNAAGLAYVGAEGLERLWRQLKSKRDIMRFNWSSLLLASSGLYHTQPLRRLLDRTVVGKPCCEAIACRVSLNTGEIQYISNYEHSFQDYKDAVQASLSIPVIMSPVAEWVDGGTREFTPLKRALKSGCTRIIVVLTRPYGANPTRVFNLQATHWWLRLVKVGFRAIVDIMEHEIFLNDLQHCIRSYIRHEHPAFELTVYAPPDHLEGDTLDFSPSRIEKAIESGYQASPLGLASLQAFLPKSMEEVRA